MSALAILLDACTLANIREPTEFYTVLSSHAQGLWLAHARNRATGAYARAEPTKEERQAAQRAAAIEAARTRGVLPQMED